MLAEDYALYATIWDEVEWGKRMFIVITGLDGSGTSTIAEKLHAIDRGSVLLHTPPNGYADRRFIDETVRETSQYAHYLYYLSANVYVSDYIRRHINLAHTNVYCVRYMIDTVVSHRAAGLDVSLDYKMHNLLKPDMTLFVCLDENERQKRISARGKSVLDKVLDNPDCRRRFAAGFEELLEDCVKVSNNEKDAAKTARQIFDQYILPQSRR